MARARAALSLTLLTTLVAAADGVRYGSDYAVRMPAYGDDDAARDRDRDDYHARSPDAPLALNYNYEDDFKEKTEQSLVGEANEPNSWRRPARKQRKRDDDDFRVDDLDNIESDDDIPKSKSVNHFTKHRPRHKSHKFEDGSEESPRFLRRLVRDRSDGIPELGGEELKPGRDRYLDDTTSSVENENYRFAYRSSSVRPRRRPRDRFQRPRTSEEEAESEDRNMDLWPQEKDKERRFENEDPLQSRSLGSLRPLRPDSGEEEEPALIHPRKDKPQSRAQYDNYDYYDMKRAMNIKNRLPSARRTQALTKWTTPPSVAERELSALLGARRQRKDVHEPVGNADNAGNAGNAGNAENAGNAGNAENTDPAATALPSVESSLPSPLGLSTRVMPPPTFPPYALDPVQNAPWNEFIAANCARAATPAPWLLGLAIMTYLDMYCIILHRIKDLCSYGNKHKCPH